MPVKEKKGFRTSVILPDEIQIRLVALADANDVSVAWVIRQAVAEYLGKHGKNDKLALKKRQNEQR